MSNESASRSIPVLGEAADGRAVSAFELFFDLVFVFAVTQVTSLLAADPTLPGLGRGLLVLAALWWNWVGYAWLTNTIEPEDLTTRLVVFGAMGSMLIVSLAVPGAFGANGVLFGLAYLITRLLWLALYLRGSREDADLRAAILRLAAPSVIGPTLLTVAGSATGSLRIWLWVAALVVDYLGPIVGGTKGWRVSPSHFAERHGLIVIIALGESIVAIGVGAAGQKIEAGVVAAAILGLVVLCTIWWAYFDVVAPVAARKLSELTGAARNGLARDSYSYLHLLLVGGIVLFALGVKTTLAHVGETLPLVPAIGLAGGAALYLVGHLLFRLRNLGTVNRPRAVATIVLLALVPVARHVPALAALACVATTTTTLIAYEVVRYREARERVRSREIATRAR